MRLEQRANAVNGEEVVCFRRRPELSGVEVRTVENSADAWRAYASEFEFVAPTSWRGEVWHRRRWGVLEPGWMLSAHPGDVLLGRVAEVPGARSSLAIDAPVWQQYLAEHGIEPRKLRFCEFTRMSDTLRAGLFNVLDSIRPGPSPLSVQAAFVEFVNTVVEELLEDSGSSPAGACQKRRVAERVRDCLHHDPSTSMDLSTIARETGLSRFQALRAFKSWYGLPPHSYQLRLRVALAQKSLREGVRPAEVAAEYGFTDQSHLTRHFRRLLGVTPAEYARAGATR